MDVPSIYIFDYLLNAVWMQHGFFFLDLTLKLYKTMHV